MNYEEAKILLNNVKSEKQKELDDNVSKYYNEVVDILGDMGKPLNIVSSLKEPITPIYDDKAGLYITLKKPNNKRWFFNPKIVIFLPYKYLESCFLKGYYSYYCGLTSDKFHPDNNLELARFVVFVGDTFNLV